MPKEEIDAVSDLRYSWKKLRKLVMDVNDKLIKLQSGFKKDLLREIKAFSVDIKSFRQDFDKNGPMVAGIAPLEAVDRLKHFQNLFNVKKHKFTNLSSGLYPCRLDHKEKEEKKITFPRFARFCLTG